VLCAACDETFASSLTFTLHHVWPVQFNVGEAVNFALPSWLHMGRLCAERYRRFVRSSVLSLEHLVCRLARHGEERSIDECDMYVAVCVSAAFFLV